MNFFEWLFGEDDILPVDEEYQWKNVSTNYGKERRFDFGGGNKQYHIHLTDDEDEKDGTFQFMGKWKQPKTIGDIYHETGMYQFCHQYLNSEPSPNTFKYEPYIHSAKKTVSPFNTRLADNYEEKPLPYLNLSNLTPSLFHYPSCKEPRISRLNLNNLNSYSPQGSSSSENWPLLSKVDTSNFWTKPLISQEDELQPYLYLYLRAV